MSYVHEFDLANIPGERLPSEFGGTYWAILAATAKYENEPFVVTDAAPGAWSVSVNAEKTKTTVTMPDDFVYPVSFALFYSPDGSTPYYADISKPYEAGFGEPGSEIIALTWRWGSIADYPASSWVMTKDQGAGEGDGNVYVSSDDPQGFIVTPSTATAPAQLTIYIAEDATTTADLIYYIDAEGATYKALFGFGSPDKIASFLDESGTLYTAVNDGDNVQVARFKTGTASRELLALIPNAKNPSYAYNRQSNRHFVSYEDRSDGAQKLVASDNSGKEFA